MRASVIRRTAVVASVGSLALLLAACGGEGKEAGKGEASAPASSAAPDAKALSAAELQKLLVAQADLPAGHMAKEAGPADVVPAEAVVTDNAACKPIADAMAFIATGKPGATARVKALALPEKDPKASPQENALKALTSPVTAVTLGSYDGQGAQDAFASLRGAGAACAAGFGVTQAGEKTKVVKVAPEAGVTGGDEALAYTVTSDIDGERTVSKVVAVRKGNTLASFSTVSLGGNVEALPKAIVDAQVKKLG
ncbi:hypothetical protein ACGFMM_12875 [Streptomyces sp. NPDC048604]|uniref:hypothetical protein n=1 Tax=Streptomyces sp. NPDC048604 TaxID=3365578 RepID=UPI0037153275